MNSIDLNPLAFPLHGSRLIEASAGTGKTWTIAALYVRLILGHGTGHTVPASTAPAADSVSATVDATGFARPLQPSEILVMTFTRAASRELSDRIRQRLLQTAQCFRGALPTTEIDAFLQQLLADYAHDPTALEQAAHRLALAADVMDDAAVFTIDAWCQRMLREHAFDSASLFDEELVDDEQLLYHDAVRDYWRSQVYALSDTDFAQVVRHWPSLQTLEDTPLRTLVKSVHLMTSEAANETLEQALCRGRATRLQQAALLKQAWVGAAPMLEAWFATHRAKINGNVYRDGTVLPFFAALTTWVHDPNRAVPDEAFFKAADKWHHEKIVGAAKGGASYTPPAEFALIAVLATALKALPTELSVMMRHAAHTIDDHMQRIKARRRQFTFADLLTRLKNALDGANGAALRQRIVAQYPVALIDEFQDTSPDQYRIFDCLYQVQQNHAATGLFLIGDPKQAIYGFRGADIHSYLAARAATAGRHYRLGTNYRSTEAVVSAINHVFACAEGTDSQPGHPRGAFGFRTATGNPLPFEPTRAAGRAERLCSSDAVVAAMTVCVRGSETAPGKADFQQQMAAHCAEKIVTWLNDASVGFRDNDVLQRLRPADIAVLVRDRYEAAAIQQALRYRRVASVYLSDKNSVFQSAEATDVLRWLAAFANPLDGKLGRIAYATRSAGLPMALLQQFSTDDLLWESCIEQLKRLQKVWQRQGVLAALRQFIQELVALAPIDQDDDGERRLTNLLHLAELLQAQSRRLDGEHALIRWLGEQIDNDGNDEEHTLRLESDAQLVQIITVFKAKGLEYPVVFVPYAVAARPFSTSRRHFIEVTDAVSGEHAIDFEMSAEAVAEKEQARLEEDLRLLYVALTRARHALWLGVASIKDELHACALGYLLAGEAPVLHAQLPDTLATHWGSNPEIVVQVVHGAASQSRFQDDRAETVLAPPLIYEGTFEQRWGITSYTALSKALQPAAIPVTANEEHLDTEGIDDLLVPELAVVLPDDRDRLAVDQVATYATAMQGREDANSRVPDTECVQPHWHRFPRGAIPGQFLHAQLEWIATSGFAIVNAPAYAEQLAARCEHSGWGHRKDDTIDWLRDVVRTDLPPVGVQLCQLTQYQSEMEFWLPIRQLRVARVDRLCQRVLSTSVARPVLTEREVTGMLRGFQDLVFEQDGRYWVLDYKSNWLGNTDADYAAPALSAAVAHHRYDVQGMIYLTALHRLLTTRLGAAYVPADHLGGVLFLFLRGIGHPVSRGCHHLRPDLAVLDELDREFNGTPLCNGTAG